jgi:fumarylpyruvate hydrolase
MSLVFAAPAPVLVPTADGRQFPVHRVYCVGRNYVEHAQEMGFSGREPPFFFLKPADAVVPVAEGETGQMAYPRLTEDLHHEVELVVAIGLGGSCIAARDAAQHIWGYGVGLDMTRRDLQTAMKKQGRPWCIGKAFDESAPLGPLTPSASMDLRGDTEIRLRVNGQLRQESQIGKLIWNVAETIEHLSTAWTLQPGDLIFTGTPAGVAAVQRGDVMEASVSGLRPLRVQVR